MTAHLQAVPIRLEGGRIGLGGHVRIARWLLTDAARRRIRPAAALLAGALAVATRPLSRTESLKYRMAGQRYRPSGGRTDAIRRIVQRPVDWRSMMPDDIPFERAAGRSLVLRAPHQSASRLIPGVLIVTFTETLRFFVHRVDLDRLQRYFRLVLEPSWAGYAVPEILSFHAARDPVLVQAAERTDREFLARLGTSLVPIALGAGEWVDYRVFKPLDRTRDYDAIYVANYQPGKRVPAFLAAVRRIIRSGVPFRAALVCSRWGTGRDVVLDFLRWHQLANHVDVYESLTPQQVNEVLNRSRCNVLMSRKEGSNRSLFEAMFAGIPGVLIRENVGVNKERFTTENGVVSRERDLPDVLVRVARDFDRFSPREWAMRHISPEASIRALTRALEECFPEDESPQPLLVKVNVPEARYLDEDLRAAQPEITEALLSLMLRDRPEPDPAEVLACVRRLGAR